MTSTPATPIPPTAAHYLLEGLMEAGVKRLFCNLGTDHVSLIEALAAWKAHGREMPDIYLCPHETVAIHMAGGYAAATGEGQAVLVHVDAGTANAAMGLHNLCRARLPVMLIAGQAPFTLRGEMTGSRDNYVHFIQDPFDIGSLVRPYVKWEYALQDPIVAKEVATRAHAVMQSDPAGPVYLTLPREALAKTCDPADVRSFPQDFFGPVKHGGLDPDTTTRIAKAIGQARKPILITTYMGRTPAHVAALTELVETYAIPVYEISPTVLNVSRESECFAGFSADAALAEADCVLLVDVDVPWLPKYAGWVRPPMCIQIDQDAIKAELPMWGFGADIRVQADSAKALQAVHQALQQQQTAELQARITERREALRSAKAKAQATIVAPTQADQPLNAVTAFTILSRHLRPQDIIVNEGIRNGPLVLKHLPRTQPGTYFANAGAGLGYSGGTALGVKIANPDAHVVQIVGDGSFHFSAPTAVYAVAQQYRIPILSIVLDNRGWQAVKESVLRVHSDGWAAQQDEFMSRLEGDTARLEAVGTAFGAHGEVVASADELEAALGRCFAALDAGQAAVLRVVLGQH